MRRPEMTISSPVCGLRPLRGRFSFTTKLPKPEILTFSPRSRRRFTISKIDSTTSVASFFEKPTFSYMRSTISAFVMVMAQGLLGVCRGNHGERGERAGERERQAQRCAAGGRSEQPSGSAAIAALLRIVRRRRHDYRDSLLRLLFLQLPLPVEHARLGALRLGLGHHAGRLVEARQAGVREDVVGRELAELLPRLDCLLVPPELVERHGEPVPAVDVAWVEGVPAVPSAAFRRVELACGPPEAVFRTSGTSGAGARGRHLVPCLALYRASALATFAPFVLPDAARLPCLCLAPPPALRPDSSLVQMCVWVGEGLASGIEWMIGERGLETERLLARLAAAEASGEALLLLGVTAAFAQLFDACRARGRAFRLGPASRIVDTGGQKGMTRPLSRPGFLRECWTLLGIPGYYCINEYGMTELCSQRYDSPLDDRFHGRSLAPRRLVGPAWLRTRVLDPDTLAAVAPGATGLLCHHDLANAGSVSVVLSEDLGRAVGDDGIEVLGRVAGAVPRGCGLLLADLEAP